MPRGVKTTPTFLDLSFPSETSVISKDKFDEASYADLLNESSELQGVEAKGKKELQVFPDLQEDVYASMYKRTIIEKSENVMKESHKLNHRLITEMRSTKEYDKIRNMTQGDQVASALATVSFSEALAEKLGSELKEEVERANLIKQYQEAIINSKNQVSNLQALVDAAKGSQQQQQFKKLLSGEIKKGNNAYKQLEDILSKPVNSVFSNQSVKSAIRQAIDTAAQDVESALESFSWGDGGCGYKYGKVRMNERLALAMHIRKSTKLRKVAEMLGRFKRMATFAQKAKLNHGSEEIYDITLGSELSRVVPAELQKLLNSATKLDFEKRFLESSLMEYALKGNVPAGMGPIIVCLDSSGSIKEIQDVWQKAVALAVLDIAQKQKRAYACIMFGGNNDPLDSTIIYPHDPEISMKAVHIAETFYGYGGTSFQKPLDAAKVIMETETKDFNKADILFATDGQCRVSEEWLQAFMTWKKQRNVRIQSVLLDVGESTPNAVKEFSNDIFRVSDFNEEKITEKIFEGV